MARLLIIFRQRHANAQGTKHQTLKQTLKREERIVRRGKLDKGIGLAGAEVRQRRVLELGNIDFGNRTIGCKHGAQFLHGGVRREAMDKDGLDTFAELRLHALLARAAPGGSVCQRGNHFMGGSVTTRRRECIRIHGDHGNGISGDIGCGIGHHEYIIDIVEGNAVVRGRGHVDKQAGSRTGTVPCFSPPSRFKFFIKGKQEGGTSVDSYVPTSIRIPTTPYKNSSFSE